MCLPDAKFLSALNWVGLALFLAVAIWPPLFSEPPCNTDVDETVLGALVTQYILTDSALEVTLIMEQVNADGLSVKVEEQKVIDLKTAPVEQHPAMLQAIAKEFNDLIAIGTFSDIEIPNNRKSISSRVSFWRSNIEQMAPSANTRPDL